MAASNAGYTAGLRVTTTPGGANTVVAPTINLHRLGAKTIKKRDTSGAKVALAAGDYNASGPFDFDYDGTDFVLLNPLSVVTGTWTPVLTFSTPGNVSVSYATQVGILSRIDNEYEATFAIVTSAFAHTAASGSLRVTGLPVASANISGIACFGTVLWQGVTKASYTRASFRVSANSNFIDFPISGSGQSQDTITAADMPTGSTVILRGSIRSRV